MNKLIALALPLLTLIGCASDSDPGPLLMDTRVLGVHVEVVGEAERASPRPGETARIDLLMDGPERGVRVSWSLAVCLPPADGKTPCTGPMLAVGSGSDDAPGLTLTVPSADLLGAVHSLHLVGAVCRRGEPELAARGARCVGDNVIGTPLLFDLALARAADGADENLQPNLADSELRFDESRWSDSAAVSPGCAGEPELPQVHADEQEHDLVLVLGPFARELYLSADGQEMYEPLQVSSFVTAGELSGQVSFVEPSDVSERPQVELRWIAPKAADLPGSEQAVRFVFAVRDGRGGLATVERSLCVVR